FDWLAAKGVDTFCPMGAGMTPAWLVDDPQELRIRCWINGELKQDSTTAQMFVGLAQIIASISTLITLDPGDVIATGTPAGVGVARGEQLREGDVVTIERGGVARLSTPVVVECPLGEPTWRGRPRWRSCEPAASGRSARAPARDAVSCGGHASGRLCREGV